MPAPSSPKSWLLVVGIIAVALLILGMVLYG